jgi:hypothetical protein
MTLVMPSQRASLPTFAFCGRQHHPSMLSREASPCDPRMSLRDKQSFSAL